MSNCPKAAFIGISPAKEKFSFVLENLTKVPEMVSTIFYFAKSPSRVTPLLFPSFNILFCSSQKLLRETIIHLIHSDSPYTPMSFLIFIVLSFSIYCSIHNCNLIGKNFVLLRHTFISDIYFIWIYVYCSIRHLLFLSLSRYFCIHHNVNRNICKRDTIYPF